MRADWLAMVTRRFPLWKGQPERGFGHPTFNWVLLSLERGGNIDQDRGSDLRHFGAVARCNNKIKQINPASAYQACRRIVQRLAVSGANSGIAAIDGFLPLSFATMQPCVWKNE